MTSASRYKILCRYCIILYWLGDVHSDVGIWIEKSKEKSCFPTYPGIAEKIKGKINKGKINIYTNSLFLSIEHIFSYLKYRIEHFDSFEKKKKAEWKRKVVFIRLR